LKNYYVLGSTRCPECRGTGLVYELLQDETRTENRDEFTFRMSMNDESLICLCCNGVGSIENKVPLKEALNAVGVHVDVMMKMIADQGKEA